MFKETKNSAAHTQCHNLRSDLIKNNKNEQKKMKEREKTRKHTINVQTINGDDDEKKNNFIKNTIVITMSMLKKEF